MQGSVDVGASDAEQNLVVKFGSDKFKEIIAKNYVRESKSKKKDSNHYQEMITGLRDKKPVDSQNINAHHGRNKPQFDSFEELHDGNLRDYIQRSEMLTREISAEI